MSVSGEGSGDSTPRAETPDRFDEEKLRKQEQKKAEQLEKRMKHEEEKKKEMDEKRQVKEEAKRIRKQIKPKERKKTLADNLIYYDRDALETGVPMRYVLHGSLELEMVLFRVQSESQTLLNKAPFFSFFLLPFLHSSPFPPSPPLSLPPN